MNNENKISANNMVVLYYQILREEIERHFSHYENKKIIDQNVPTGQIHKELESYRADLTQSEVKNVKIRFVVEALLYDGKPHTIEEISALTMLANQLNNFIPTISSSSIQRYLHTPYVRAKYGEDTVQKIKEMLEYNYVTGKSVGGIVFSKNNDSTRSADGSFTGSTPKTTPYVAPTYTNLVIEQARLFLSGKTYEEIAAIYTESLGHPVTATDVKRKLTVDLKKVDKELFKEVESYKQKIRQSIVTEEKNKLLNVYDLYVEKGFSYLEIAELYKVSTSTISRLLGTRMVEMSRKFPDEITQEMIERVKEVRKLNESRPHAGAR